MEPPPVRINKRKSKGRLTRNERSEINSRGIAVPSRNVKNFEPNVNENVLLWNSGVLPGSKPFNYRNKAKVNFKNTWEGYLKQRANANALAKKRPNNTKRNNKNNNNNGTRRALF